MFFHIYILGEQNITLNDSAYLSISFKKLKNIYYISKIYNISIYIYIYQFNIKKYPNIPYFE